MLKRYILNMTNLSNAINEMILSHSGFRKIFAKSKNENSIEYEINDDDKILVALITLTISNYFKDKPKKYINVGSDSRATGNIISEIIIKTLILNNNSVKFFGILPIPEILAYTKENQNSKGFIYISASHNPTGYNGIKIGLNDGGVLNSNETKKIICQIRSNIENETLINNLITNLQKFNTNALHLKTYETIITSQARHKTQSYNSYKSLMQQIIYSDTHNQKNIDILKKTIKKEPIGIIGEMNGSSRINSIDREMIESLGIKLEFHNTEIGIFKHGMTPEGTSLNMCKQILEQKFKNDNSFKLGYVPDCDGDRGNLVAILKKEQASIITPQKIFALSVLSELSYLYHTGIKDNLAIVVNDATSLNIEKIASLFNTKVYRVEVGEANLTEMADLLRNKGLIVKILGEGSNGGNITYPSKVRDPLTTLFSIIKLLKIKNLYKIWCSISNNSYNEHYTLGDILKTINFYSNVEVSSEKAMLKIKVENQEILKTNYEKLLDKEFNNNNNTVLHKLPIHNYEIINYEGIKQNISRTGDSSGGLKVLFKNNKHEIIASLWFRGSKTEPIFRVLSEVISEHNDLLYPLLDFHIDLIHSANSLI
ncbi:phosphoglucomutase [Borrelia turicatae]|nr:phosphoglucomutase [Borrelia turicatae]ANF34293.1 phosphoglucomutase [Borrelia turicatae]UPA13665.1 phosphoglucomutase [Borrelia turicatae 91E135]UPA13711.1 phosphoglucomutase [Borrelia turicatae 91E135]UPA14066.1 phosphoglucomutase [Borrelia turicatae 91E135]UPA14378.1 phosphoglucomutase [Borrelia turicatae]